MDLSAAALLSGGISVPGGNFRIVIHDGSLSAATSGGRDGVTTYRPLHEALAGVAVKIVANATFV